MNTATKNNEATDTLPPSFTETLTDEQLGTYRRIPDQMDYVDNPLFSTAKAEQRLFGDGAMDVDVPVWTSCADDVVDVSKAPKRKTSLTDEEEVELFLRHNYACYRLGKLIKAQNRRRSLGRARQMIHWFKRVMRTRAALASANMALVLAMAKRTRIPNVEFSELVSEGNMALLRSIEKFDVARGFKFSTYACRAILKGFNRLATKTGRYRQYFPTEYDPAMERSDYDEKKHEMQRDDSVQSLRDIISQNRARLTETEQLIVMERFALGRDGEKGRTLAQVGKMVGLTNERVRQIQNHALDKLRSALDTHYLVA
ncbi:MAG: sigma-70 family RNA polymerase sigma factor [Planctomycetes bacterium]|jgi:RNA polymerase sigma factor (sigma-70 family)|nr:sigma-70 family RNA polymerase sigma factor [Phycisphaerae bacterium]NBB95081.1 sigma-70 family RNA polymerase sigma factor [Planctomycetota bacterium]